MIYPIVIFAICVILTISLTIYDHQHDPDNVSADLLLGTTFSALIAIVLTAVLWACLYPFTGPVHHTTRATLVNLQDAPGSSGNYFLGIGSTQGTLSVSYYTNTTHGASTYASPHTVSEDAETIRIYQDLPANAQPYVTRTEADAHFWTGSLYNGVNTPDIYAFHVPPGTVKQDFTLDAK